MALILAGIDEAGYGPMLGPLAVGVSVWRIEEWSPGDRAPDLWKVLSSGVCRKGSDARGRVAIEDSKKLKLANDSARHPLVHLEAGVLCALRQLGVTPTTDAELFNALGVRRERHAWYGGEAMVCPQANDAGMLAIRANMLAASMEEARVQMLAMRVTSVGESAFNELVRRERSKAATTAHALGGHLGQVWQEWGVVEAGDDEGGPRVVCDRQGGRSDYAGYLFQIMRHVEGAKDIEVREVEQSDTRSRYVVSGRGGREGDDRPRRMSVVFQVEGESACLPVALASMGAKLVREMMMQRFNRYWQARAAEVGMMELKPTAGYTTDARRWLRDAKPIVTSEERETMVRIA